MKNLILISLLLLGVATITQAANEGIQVHGHWQFDIYNKDGSFDRKVEFENALRFEGKALLAKLLVGDNTSGLWTILIESDVDLCNSTFNDCRMVETTSGNPSSAFTFKNLVVSLESVNQQSFDLKGSFQALIDGSIHTVSTYNSKCSNFEIPRSCSDVGASNLFTQKSLDTPVNIQATQTVNVTVTISFS